MTTHDTLICYVYTIVYVSNIAPILGGVVAILGLTAGYLASRKAKAVIAAAQSFAVLGANYYAMRPDGYTATEKDALAEAAIAFFDAVERAGVEITRPG